MSITYTESPNSQLKLSHFLYCFFNVGLSSRSKPIDNSIILITFLDKFYDSFGLSMCTFSYTHTHTNTHTHTRTHTHIHTHTLEHTHTHTHFRMHPWFPPSHLMDGCSPFILAAFLIAPYHSFPITRIFPPPEKSMLPHPIKNRVTYKVTFYRVCQRIK